MCLLLVEIALGNKEYYLISIIKYILFIYSYFLLENSNTLEFEKGFGK